MKKSVLLMFAVIAIVLSGCSSSGDEEDNLIKLSSSEVVLYSGETYQIEAKSDNKISYQSKNEYFAKVSITGLITANKVGETNIQLINGYDTKDVKVITRAKSNLYPEPYLKWGTSKSDLIKLFGKPDSETKNTISYVNYSTNTPAILYAFDDNNTLNGVNVAVKSIFSSQLGTFLGERYVLYTSEKDSFYLLNGLSDDTISMGVKASLYNINYWFVLYFPIDLNSKSMESNSVELAEAINVLITDK